ALERGGNERTHHRGDAHRDDDLEERESGCASHWRIGLPKGSSVAPGGVLPRIGPWKGCGPGVRTLGKGWPGTWPGTAGAPGAPGAPGVAESAAPGVPLRSEPCRSEKTSLTKSMFSVRLPSFQLTVRWTSRTPRWICCRSCCICVWAR